MLYPQHSITNINEFCLVLVAMSLVSFMIIALYNGITTPSNRNIGIVVSVLASSIVYHGFKPQSGQTKDYKMVFAASPLSM